MLNSVSNREPPPPAAGGGVVAGVVSGVVPGGSPGAGALPDDAAALAPRMAMMGGGAALVRGFAPPRAGVRARNPVTGLETIIGDDERLAVPDASADPWRRICQLDLKGRLGNFKGTGWFAGPATVITAGHCVHYPQFFDGWAEEITVSPGRTGDSFPLGRARSGWFSTVDVWRDGQNADFDMAAIHLDEPLGNAAGIFPCRVLDDPALIGRMVNISGYPTDRDLARVQYHHANRIMAVTARRLFYDIDTVSGQSGAPVWVQDDPAAAPACVGIHAYGVPGTPLDLHILANSAPRFDAEVLAVIGAWVARDNARLGLAGAQPVSPWGTT
ncbi:MAG: trypsin-like peptidase domain-containing protein [Paracoccaceae bacterium]